MLRWAYPLDKFIITQLQLNISIICPALRRAYPLVYNIDSSLIYGYYVSILSIPKKAKSQTIEIRLITVWGNDFLKRVVKL